MISPSLGARMRSLLIATTGVFLMFHVYDCVDYETMEIEEIHAYVNIAEPIGNPSTISISTTVDLSTTATVSPLAEIHNYDQKPLGALIAAAMHTADVSWMNELADKYDASLLHS